MRVKLFLVVFWLIITKCYSQKPDSINYTIPEVVSAKVANYIEEDIKKPYYIIIGTKNDTTSLLVSTYDKSFQKLAYLVSNSNRYIRISHKKTLPVISDVDLLFSTVLHTVKNKGKYNELVTNTLVMASGYLIIFTVAGHKASVVSAQYYQN